MKKTSIQSKAIAIISSGLVLAIVLFLQSFYYATAPAVAPNKFKEDKYVDSVQAVKHFNVTLVWELSIALIIVYLINKLLVDKRKIKPSTLNIIILLVIALASVIHLYFLSSDYIEKMMANNY